MGIFSIRLAEVCNFDASGVFTSYSLSKRETATNGLLSVNKKYEKSPTTSVNL